MGTLSTELAPHAGRFSPRPRIYADANVPARLVAFMREKLDWDVLFVIEDDDLRRAPDARHYHLAQQLRRTLITLDRDYLDDRRFPPEEGAGVLVIQAPDERQLFEIVKRVSRLIFGAGGTRHTPDATESAALVNSDMVSEQPSAGLPLEGRKMHVHTDWGRDAG